MRFVQHCLMHNTLLAPLEIRIELAGCDGLLSGDDCQSRWRI